MPRPGWLGRVAQPGRAAPDLFGDLLDRPAHAAEAGVRVTSTVLLEVEATLQAALVDLAGALTIATAVWFDRSRTAASGGGHGSTSERWRRLPTCGMLTYRGNG